MSVCYLGIGSNLGNRRENIKSAIEKIRILKDTRVIKVSKIIETSPVAGPRRQGKFLNAALKISTAFVPSTLLKKLKEIEKELGRKKTVRYGPRAIDLDILFYADKVIDKKELKIPHPKILERDFVVRPLLEIM